MRAHVIEFGRVANTIEVESLDKLPGWQLVDAALGGQIGDLYDDVTGAFTEPPPEPAPVPEVVTMRQARLALLSAGKLALVDTTINSLPSPDKEAARIEWDYATEVRRDWPLVLTLGLDSAGLDELFVAASAL